MQTKITLGYLGFLPFATLTILPWILGETYEEISFQLLVVKLVKEYLMILVKS